MKPARIYLLLFVLALGLGACGKKGDLEPPEKYKESLLHTELGLG